MKFSECLRTLELKEGATLEDVKKSFRKLAFKYHPDLNNDPSAPLRFRDVNEAYVFVKNELEKRKGKSSAQTDSEDRKTSRAEGARAYARQQAKSTFRKAKAKAQKTAKSARSKQQGFYYKEEEVTQTIMSDPFARKVFQDIYSQIRKDQPGYEGPLEVNKRNLKLKWGDKALGLDLSKGVGGSIKSWFKGQMDHEQVVYFPAMTLVPGRKVRITVEQKFSEGPKTIEVTLPQDFVVGRPIRLKGLGKKLGPVTGDLLLKIYAK